MSTLEPHVDHRIVALIEEQQHLNERLDQVTAEHAGLLEEVRGSPVRRRRPPWWPLLPPDIRDQLWADLLDWLQHTLLARQPGLGELLTSGVDGGSDADTSQACWYRHPDVVDDLTVLYALWRDAYLGPQASAFATAEWLDRWVPAFRHRIGDSLKGCRRDHHYSIDQLPGDDGAMRRWVGGIDPS